MAKMIYPKSLKGLQFGEWEVIEKGSGLNWVCKCSCGEIREVSRGNLISHDSTSCGHNSKKDKLVDLSGQHFGELKVIEYNKKIKKWLCECSCGNKVYKRSWDLRNGKGKTCGDTSKHNSKRLIDLKDKEFGEIKVIEYAGMGEWKCKCSCGKVILVDGSDLRRGIKTSCGHTLNQWKIMDITNKQFGELKALTRLPNGKWDCICSCGNHREVYISRLTSGAVVSCGHEYNKLIDLTDDIFGQLKVLSYNKSINKWLCQCSCGNKVYVYSQHLRRGDARSCGCTRTRLSMEEILNCISELSTELNRKPYSIEVCNKLHCRDNLLREKFKRSDKNIYEYIALNTARSSFEISVSNFIKEIYINGTIEENNRQILDGLEVDIVTPIALVECNGNYYHSSYFKDEAYHQNKTILASRKGLRLIHIYEHEWNDEHNRELIKNYLINIFCRDRIQKVYARDTNVKEITTEEAKEFLGKYHIQGYGRSEKRIALVNRDGDIISVMTFAKPRFDNQQEYEIIRYCNKFGLNIVGGAEKIFKYFVNKYNAQSIVSYCNLDKFTGGVYSRLGFTVDGITKPGYFWSNHRATNILSRYQTQKSKLIDNGLGTEEQTEDEIMQELGYCKVYNAGNLKFIWSNT